MTAEEVRLRSLLAIKTGDVKYVKDIPRELQIYCLYPQRMRPFTILPNGKVEFGPDPDEDNLKKLKEKLDKEFEDDKNQRIEKRDQFFF